MKLDISPHRLLISPVMCIECSLTPLPKHNRFSQWIKQVVSLVCFLKPHEYQTSVFSRLLLPISHCPIVPVTKHKVPRNYSYNAAT